MVLKEALCLKLRFYAELWSPGPGIVYCIQRKGYRPAAGKYTKSGVNLLCLRQAISRCLCCPPNLLISSPPLCLFVLQFVLDWTHCLLPISICLCAKERFIFGQVQRRVDMCDERREACPRVCTRRNRENIRWMKDNREIYLLCFSGRTSGILCCLLCRDFACSPCVYHGFLPLSKNM